MDALFWERLHGGSTHLPVVLLPVSMILDLVALKAGEEGPRRAFHSVGMAFASAGVAAGCAAVAAGLMMSHGQLFGSGLERLHHLFVWPAFTSSVVLVMWRLVRQRRISARGLRRYLVGMCVASALMLGAGYWAGEILLHAEESSATSTSSKQEPAVVARGHDLFMMNCAHCHGDDACGTE